jgi:hypothetical protein
VFWGLILRWEILFLGRVVGIYCTGCGVTGKLHYDGAIKFSLYKSVILTSTINP